MKEVLANLPEVSEYAREAIRQFRHRNQGICCAWWDRRIQIIFYGIAMPEYIYRRNGVSRQT